MERIINGQIDLLIKNKFNDDQIELIQKVSQEFLALKDLRISDEEEYYNVDWDGWERNQWYVFNRSGLFEDDNTNKTGITNWTQYHTRKYITEL